MNIDKHLEGFDILVVEDESDTREIFAYIFTLVGANVKVARSVKEALQTLEEFTPDITISDVELPDGSGCSLISEIKEIMRGRGRNIKGLAVTSSIGNGDRASFKKAGFEECLSKPCDLNDLIKVVVGMGNQ